MKYRIETKKTENSNLPTLDFANLDFGRNFSDHMFTADYKDGEWTNFQIIPFGYLPMHPAMSSIHYGQAIFEGLKARKNDKNEVIVFRPEMNLRRLNVSARRMAMPEIPEDLFFQAMNELLSVDEGWVPNHPGTSLYIRPFMYATDEFIGIKRSESYKFVILTCPVGAYYTTPVKVYASDKYVRAFPGGTGFAKTAGNYAGTIQPVEEIHKKGYHQILWLDGIEKKYLQEIGTMNFFVVIDGKVITPNLDEGTILPGITRDSIITLLNDWGVPVEERKITIDEVIEASKNGTLEDAFGAGTAATVSFIDRIGYKDMDILIPPVEDRVISHKVLAALTKIKDGIAEDKYNWLYKLQLTEA